ncbi:MAG TPA: ABC transporter ATP-binding protein [Bdellovibrionota bacterium]|jgi:iron(III) transport system ATP-binding protein|nr:ABC transporter ATP-binding protein [Bdellovibrionota bacterium]
MSSLELKGVAKSFGPVEVLKPLDLVVEDKSFVALLGPSGCGKTTLLRMVAGLEAPSAGTIAIGGRTVWGPSDRIPPEERGLGMVFQTYAVWPHKTAFGNVEYPLLASPRLRAKYPDAGARRAAVERALKLVRLEGLADRYPHQLSGGQQQRVALARGLVMEPPILLLDEPLSNLDAKLRGEMRRELRDLHRSLGITILYVTHDQREAFEMSTRVLVMHQGRIAQDGSPEDVRSRPSPGFVKEFLAES